MNTGQCQTNAVYKFINRTEKGGFSGGDNTPLFNRVKCSQDSSPILNKEIEQRFLHITGILDPRVSCLDAYPGPAKCNKQEFTAPKSSSNESLWAKDFKLNSTTSQSKFPLQKEFTTLSMNNGPRMAQIGSPFSYFSQKTSRMGVFPTVDHQVPKARNLQLPVSSQIDSLISAEFLELERNQLQEGTNTQEENSDLELEEEEAAVKCLASDIVEFCDNNSTDAELKEKLASSKFVGLMGNISDGSITLKKEESTEKRPQKHVGFCFEGAESWAGLEFHDIEDRILQ